MTRILSDRLERWRADTPGCERCIHLNNAGAALMPESVTQAVTSHLFLEAEIGGYEAAYLREKAIDATYARLGALVSAKPRNMAVVSSATMAFVKALSSLDLDPGDVIVTSRSDYTSHQIQYLSLARRLGVEVIHAPELPEGGVDPDGVRRILRSKACRLVSISWVPTHSGLVQDVASVGAVCQDAGVTYLIDACQAAGQIPIDVNALGCDYLTCTARKFLRGPRGVGFLFASDRVLARGDYPLFVDMHGATWTEPESFQIGASASRYEEWEKAYSLMLGMSEAVRFALQEGIEETGRRARGLAESTRQHLQALPGVRILDRGGELCAIVTAEMANTDISWFATQLRSRGINTAVSDRWHGLLDFSERGIASALRISPHYYNTQQEIDVLVSTVKELLPA